MKKKMPRGLQKEGQRFWKEILGEIIFEDSHDYELLNQACRTLDDIALNEKIIEKEGAYVKDRFSQVREHPACRAIRNQRVIFARLIRELNLSIDTPEESRPPRLY
ncbi:MAG: hypothetical protein JXQ25_03550 [Deltaproteobacteria bacterium]|nr:hypothetical protein [Deltaproteobacteria bacterium]